MKKIAAGHRVSVARDIVRGEGPYASAGEVGEVIETFKENVNSPTVWHAKVKMDAGGIKTFRVTSLQREGNAL